MAVPLSRKRPGRKAIRTQYRTPAWQQSNLDLPSGATDKLINLLAKGLPFSAFASFSDKAGIPAPELALILRIPTRTLVRRRSAGRLAPDESERLMRLVNIFEKAVQLFEGKIRPAVNWLRSPKKALSNHSPLEYVSFEISAREVENLIGRLEHGTFS